MSGSMIFVDVYQEVWSQKDDINLTEFLPAQIKTQQLTALSLGNLTLALNTYTNLKTIPVEPEEILVTRKNQEKILGFSEQIATSLLNMETIAYGVNLKMFSTEMVTQKGKTQLSGSGFGIDTGLLIRATEDLQVGITLKKYFSYRPSTKKHGRN